MTAPRTGSRSPRTPAPPRHPRPATWQELRRVDRLFTAPVGPRSLPWPYSGACTPTPRFKRARRYWEDVVRGWTPLDDE